MDLDKLEAIKEDLLKLNNDELYYVVKNTYYSLVSYYDENHKGKIYDGSYDQESIEQATRLQQHIRNDVDLFHQVIDHRIFEKDYFEDLLTDNYYSKYKDAEKRAKENEEKAWKYDSLCDE